MPRKNNMPRNKIPRVNKDDLKSVQIIEDKKPKIGGTESTSKLYSRPLSSPRKSPNVVSTIGDGEHLKCEASRSPNTKKIKPASNMADSINQNKLKGKGKEILKETPRTIPGVKSPKAKISTGANIPKIPIPPKTNKISTKIAFEDDIDLEPPPSDISSSEEFEYYEQLIEEQAKARDEDMCGEEYAVVKYEFEEPVVPVIYPERFLSSMEPVLESIAEENSDDDNDFEVRTQKSSENSFAMSYAYCESIVHEVHKNNKIELKYGDKKLPPIQHIVLQIPEPEHHVSIVIERKAPILEEVEIIEPMEMESLGIKNGLVKIRRMLNTAGLNTVERIIYWKSSLKLPVWLKKVIRKVRKIPMKKSVSQSDHYCQSLRSTMRICSRCERVVSGAVFSRPSNAFSCMMGLCAVATVITVYVSYSNNFLMCRTLFAIGKYALQSNTDPFSVLVLKWFNLLE